MGLIALIAFWGLNGKLWISTGDIRLPLIFAALWGASLFGMGMLGLGQFFIVAEVALIIAIFFTEKSKSL